MQLELADPPSRLQRRLAAVMMLDVAGYSRLTEADVEGTHRRWMAILTGIVCPAVIENGGQIINRTGDGALMEFASATLAVRAATRIQSAADAFERARPLRERVRLRIGINLGDVIVEDGVEGIFGDGVNVAARLESIAEPGSVIISEAAMSMVDRTDFAFVDLGRQKLKNITRPIRAFAVARKDMPAARGWPWRGARSVKTRKRALLALSLVVVLSAGGADVLVGEYVAYRQSQELVMILPFRNLSGNGEEDYLVDAIADDLTNDLARARQGHVISSTTALSYKGRFVDARQIGRECGVRYLVEGTIRRVGGVVTVNAQLIDTRTGGNIWAERFSHDSRTPAELQDLLTRRLSASLNFKMAEVRRNGSVGSFAADGNPLDERLRAMSLVVGTPSPAASAEAQERVRRALAQDPQSADSLGLLARLLVSDFLNNWNGATRREVEEARGLVTRTLAIDPNSWQAHFADSQVRRVDGDHAAALAALQRTVSLNPSFAAAYAQIGNELLALGRVQEAPDWGIKAANVDPRGPSLSTFFWVTGRAYFVGKQYARAAEWLEKSVQERPSIWFSRAWLASALALTRKAARAKESAAELQRRFPEFDLQHIRDYYEKQARFQNPAIQASLPHLFEGLRRAGLR